jgi:Phasin protein
MLFTRCFDPDLEMARAGVRGRRAEAQANAVKSEESVTDHTKLREQPVDDAPTGGPHVSKARAMEPSALARPRSPLPAPYGPASSYGFLFEANQHAFTSWFRGIGTLSGELTRFIQDRLSDDMAAWSALASCRTAEEAFECQRRFAEKATAQYSEEITKLSQLMLHLATDGLQSFQRSAR